MKIKVLGSSAAEAVPALWCECPVCAHARKNKGRDVRRRTCYLIDDDTLVDFGPDIYAQTLEFDIDLTRIRRILITHSHEDHLNPVDLSWRRPGFSHVTKEIDLYANQSSLNRILALIPAPGFSLHKIREHLLSPGVPVTSGDIRILPIEASHASPEETALNYILERNGKKILIANDTGWWKSESWEMVGGAALDAAVIESTSPLRKMNYDGHLDGDKTIAFRDELLRIGALTPSSLVFTNHFSHNGAPVHADMEAFFSPRGITTCYDGLEFEI